MSVYSLSSARTEEVVGLKDLHELLRVVADDVTEAVTPVAVSDSGDGVVLQVVAVDVVAGVRVQQALVHALLSIAQELLALNTHTQSKCEVNRTLGDFKISNHFVLARACIWKTVRTRESTRDFFT